MENVCTTFNCTKGIKKKGTEKQKSFHFTT